MMRCVLVLVAFLTMAGESLAGNRYPVSDIPVQLLMGANVVKRVEEIEYRFVNTGEAVCRQKYAITILNESGEDHAEFVEFYDKLQKVVSVEGALYDAFGNEIKKLRPKDITDASAVSSSDLFGDDRVKQHRFYHKTYPYTIEYEVEIRYHHTMSIPRWMPQEDGCFAVQQSSFTLITPADYSVRHRAFNYTGEPAVTTANGKKTSKWEVKNMSVKRKLFASPLWRELTTAVYFAPSQFEIQGYKGNMDNWEEFGKFQLALNKGRDELPPALVQRVAQITAGASSDAQKVERLYEFLQKNTRYISIQLGIGGWQPFEASFVSEKGYGDCKALSNYMYSLLKAAGIKSNYVLVFAGKGYEQNLIEDFPSRQFNHAILCVPLKKDTMWLECTSQTAPPGYMGGFTGNRKALLVSEQGSRIVSTPRYDIEQNTMVRKMTGAISPDGNLTIQTTAFYKGVQQDPVNSMINQLTKEEIKSHLQRSLELATYEVSDFRYQEKKAVLPEMEEQMNITVHGYATITGKRLFVTPNILARSSTRVEEEKRTLDFVFDYAFRNEDRAEIEIPEGYEIESAPKDVSLKTKFGSYSASSKLEGNKIIYTRVKEQYAVRLPASESAAVSKFFEEIYKADRSRIVLVKKSETN